MSERKQGTLDGRAVELREVSIGTALAARKASDGDAFETSLRVLVAAAYWAGTDERVFANREAIDARPMRQMREIGTLANLASDANSPHAAEAPATTNGTGAELGPSP